MHRPCLAQDSSSGCQRQGEAGQRGSFRVGGAVPCEGGGGVWVRGGAHPRTPGLWNGEVREEAARGQAEGSVAPEPLVPLVDGSRRAFALMLLKGHV